MPIQPRFTRRASTYRSLQRTTKCMSTVGSYLDHDGEWLWNDALRTTLAVNTRQCLASLTERSCRHQPLERKLALFLLGFDNGADAIARIPSALVGNVHMSTAGEVATTEYEQISSSWRGYMEDHWLNSFDADMGATLKDLVFFDARLHDKFFSQTGSLFFKEDKRIVLGLLLTGNAVEGDRGPWLDMTSSIQSTCQLALRRTESHAASATSSHPVCSSAAPYLNPSSEPVLTFPRLTHPDLSQSNIIAEAANVLSYIDWQGIMTFPYIQCTVLPPARCPRISPPELREQADLELRLAKWHRLTSSVLLRRIPLPPTTACVLRAQLLTSLPETAALRCYANGPKDLRHLVRELCDARRAFLLST
ncbi:uncharacterized protein BT62DRAFT_1007097 [Guyanagaster necrorhizus]|uniref:Aminoglycoside phosphotransferase domain-containing protein n=1 Tax=Guyanagaster necrorhizus TaxID=856835 RepID=A0A9P8ARN2_9AGAR|nr:uncharacterized protein BT62DRAFT_1007097 [Guyanagaster necrorhizus MCA 3950]KAG7445369.1 hypothetical protein BT62DRAFT_1007097 [Guyanagaster necrorhizus MCA 3950]